MSRDPMLTSLIRFDLWSWYFFIAWFGSGMILWLAGSDSGATIAYWGIVLVLVNNLIRLLFVAEHFKISHQPRYRMLAYILLAVLVLSIGVQMLR